MGSIKRIYKCLVIDPTDTFAYVGTQTGDIIEISLEKALFKRIGPVKRLSHKELFALLKFQMETSWSEQEMEQLPKLGSKI